MLALRALVVDDSRTVRNLVMQSLRRSGLAEWEFAEAESGTDGLARFDPAAVDICFVDWHMPDMAGPEFVRRVRATGTSGHVPMVLVAGGPALADAEAAAPAAGANACIGKPFAADELQATLQPLIDRLAGMRAAAARGSWLMKLFA